MKAFLDTSALVKRYVEEAGSSVVRELALAAISALSTVELPAALWHKHRIRELTVDRADALSRAFVFDLEDDDAPFVVVDLSREVLASAAGFPRTHGLRAYDAVQLASAVALASVAADDVTFVSADRALARAASAEGLEVLVPE